MDDHQGPIHAHSASPIVGALAYVSRMDFHISLVGRLRPGDALPPTRELASRLHVARTTVTGAYTRLAGEGYVTSRVGAGTFVSAHAARARAKAPPRRSGGALSPRPLWDSIPLSAAFV